MMELRSVTVASATNGQRDIAQSSLMERAFQAGCKKIILYKHCRLFRDGLEGMLKHTGIQVASYESYVATDKRSDPKDDMADLLILRARHDAEAKDCFKAICHTREKSSGLRTIILADQPTATILQEASTLEIDAVLSTNISPEILCGSIELVFLGQRLFPAPYPAALRDCQTQSMSDDSSVQGGPALSEREYQILRFLSKRTRKLIAFDLGISEATVKFHIRALLRKIGVANRTQAAMWYTGYGQE